jgi:predicted regulator of Ras-like GTPase activity (Roadblock/LC7/MglB family)
MNNNNPLYSPNLKEIRQILDQIKDLGKLDGVMLANRDGVLIVENINIRSDYNEFAAMTASVLESAEDMGNTIGINKIGNILAELENQSIIIIKCDDTNTFLTLIFKKESNIERVLQKLDDYCQKIANIY